MVKSINFEAPHYVFFSRLLFLRYMLCSHTHTHTHCVFPLAKDNQIIIYSHSTAIVSAADTASIIKRINAIQRPELGAVCVTS
jgi:hypothetical protein